MTRLTALIRRIVGRIDMARLLRDFTLIVFGFFVVLVIPTLPELLQLQINAPVKLVILVAVIITAIPYLFLIYWLGKLEERQQEKRDKKLIGEILRGLGYGKRDKESERFQSVL